MSFQPRVDPLSLQTDRSASTDARVLQLATLAGSVNRVTADTCILRTLGNGQPNLHRSSARARSSASVKWLLGVRARTRQRHADAFLPARGCGHVADIEPRGRLFLAGVGNDLSDRRVHNRRVGELRTYVEAAKRRRRPTPGLRTSDAECR